MRSRQVLSVCLISLVMVALAFASADARRVNQTNQLRFTESPTPADLPTDLLPYVQGPSLSSAVADTFDLAWFSFGVGAPDAQGWVSVDMTAQEDIYFHVADGSELDGGQSGALLPLEGGKSAWCGASPAAGPPLCAYATLPGYGNSWVQSLESKEFSGCDSLRLYYLIQWDSEPGYDFTRVQWREVGSTDWIDFPSVNGGAGDYDGTGSLSECVAIGDPGGTGLQLRFNFTSDGAWSDEDGLWPTDGAALVDSITVIWYNEVPPNSGNWVVSGSYYEDFEGEAAGATVTDDGCWTATVPPGFGEFAALYQGLSVLQEDPCFTNFGFLWGFFDDPLITNYNCHLPNPETTQGAMRFGPDVNGLYQHNEIWSPEIPMAGAGDEFWLTFLTYRDLPLDNLQFYQWHARSIYAGCPGSWGDDSFVFYGGQKDWLNTSFSIGAHVDGSADAVQIALSSIDGCAFWCLVFGTGACHSHAPLLDQVHLKRVNTIGPQITVRHLDLFQDTFAADGTTTGHGHADCANDIAPSASPTILPGDSITMSATNVGSDALSGTGPSAYVYVSVLPQGQLGKTPADMEAPETRPNVGKRFPLVNTIVHDGVTWACYRMDSVVTTAGAIVSDRWCFDLNDWVFNPCDTVQYVICAEDGSGNPAYFSRTLNGQGANFVSTSLNAALESPMEFTILPAGGWKRGGDILYVDDADDRGGPAQLFFDTAFDWLGLWGLVDRYDVMGPSSNVANSLASRVTNIQTQIVSCYRKILWCSSNLSSGLLGDGTGNPEKSDDYGLIFTFLDIHPNLPGVYLSGDDMAEEWASLSGASAISLRSVYMNFNLIDGDHVNAGESVSPTLTATGACFLIPAPNQLIAYGGCAAINDFDVLGQTGLSAVEFPYPGGSGAAVLSQTTPNQNGSTARVILSGFGFNYIRDPGFGPGYVLARARHMHNMLLWFQNVVAPPTGPKDGAAPRNFLANAAPNPFNPETTIEYGIRYRGHVTLRVYNVAGQLVRTLVDEVQIPGPDGLRVTWDGRSDAGQAVSSGVYFYKLATPGFTETKKMVLLK